MKQWKVAASTALLLALGLLLLSVAVTGLQSGAVEDIGRNSPASAAVLRAAHPFHFWFAVLFWLLIGGLAVWMSLASALSLWRKTPAAQARKKAALDRITAAQVRRVEAGQGPEPPWIRFPGPADALPEAEMTAYLENVFAPFWLPLGAEARAAYLRRNPPPNQEWQEFMADLLDLDVMPD